MGGKTAFGAGRRDGLSGRMRHYDGISARSSASNWPAMVRRRGGNSLLVGGSGTALLDGGFSSTSHDTLVGGSNNETLTVAHGSNQLFAGSGNDTLFAGNGHDTLNGGSGNNSFVLGKGTDSVAGGSGDDSVFITTNHGHDTIDGGGGTNTVTFDHRAFASATITTSGATTSISFANGQSVQVTNVTQLVFTDGTHTV